MNIWLSSSLCAIILSSIVVWLQGEPPSFRDFHTATAVDGRMYIFGGRGDENAPQHTNEDLYCNRMVYLDVHDNTWYTPVTSGDIPIGRRSHVACELLS